MLKKSFVAETRPDLAENVSGIPVSQGDHHLGLQVLNGALHRVLDVVVDPVNVVVVALFVPFVSS